MRELNPVDIDTLVAISGMVIRTSSLIPDLRQAFFECANPACKTEVRGEWDRVPRASPLQGATLV
jgi:DNA replication licensing factor MCM4